MYYSERKTKRREKSVKLPDAVIYNLDKLFVYDKKTDKLILKKRLPYSSIKFLFKWFALTVDIMEQGKK